jgi:hypothetical protein
VERYLEEIAKTYEVSWQSDILVHEEGTDEDDDSDDDTSSNGGGQAEVKRLYGQVITFQVLTAFCFYLARLSLKLLWSLLWKLIIKDYPM